MTFYYTRLKPEFSTFLTLVDSHQNAMTFSKNLINFLVVEFNKLYDALYSLFPSGLQREE